MDQQDERYLVVSIHDLSPVTWRKVSTIQDALKGIGIEQSSLLLIPNFQGAHPVDRADEEFRAWLAAVAQSDEVCLHGYTHQAAAIRGGPVARGMATLYTNREGEFYQLSGEEATRLLRQGLVHFEGLGIKPAGFVAPAWLLNEEVEAALSQLGFTYTTRLRSIQLLEEPARTLEAPTCCYSVRSAWRRGLSRLWNPLLAAREKRQSILRMSIHPVDLDHPAIFKQILSLTRQAAGERKVVTYSALVERLTKN